MACSCLATAGSPVRFGDVVVDTAHAMNARCHWCRHTLNVNQRTPNGAVPDAGGRDGGVPRDGAAIRDEAILRVDPNHVDALLLLADIQLRCGNEAAS